MTRTLTFQLISDSRQGENETSHAELVHALCQRLGQLPTVAVTSKPANLYHFGDTASYRTRFHITKSRAVTWDQVKQTINTVRACHYTFTN